MFNCLTESELMAERKPVRVLVVDDSALMRRLITSILSSDPEVEVIGAVNDPFAAREKIKELNPDVITLDVEMPRMDGIAFLEKIMSLRPMPVVMFSSLTREGADVTLRALELGAVDFLTKPDGALQIGLAERQAEIIAKVKAAARSRVRQMPLPSRTAVRCGPYSPDRIIAIGASTGGVEALNHILRAMPADSPGIVITLHMPPKFTASFARRLDDVCAVKVKEAQSGDVVLPGHAYIAPGHAHLRIRRSATNYVCVVEGNDRVNGHCPSVDALFFSAAEQAGPKAIGVILTGMGRDGADGLLAMRTNGARTLGQDEASCVVYGMPKVAFQRGAVEAEIALADMAGQIMALLSGEGRRKPATSRHSHEIFSNSRDAK